MPTRQRVSEIPSHRTAWMSWNNVTWQVSVWKSTYSICFATFKYIFVYRNATGSTDRLCLWQFCARSFQSEPYVRCRAPRTTSRIWVVKNLMQEWFFVVCVWSIEMLHVDSLIAHIGIKCNQREKIQGGFAADGVCSWAGNFVVHYSLYKVEQL